jgi:hypothetical protein
LQPFHHSRAGKLHFFCPLCKHHQSTNSINKVKLKHHFQLALATLAVTGVTWPIFGEKGLFLYFFFWLAFEFAYRLRKRQALICESCGFDPFLYKQDVQKARAALKKHWEHRIETENLFAGKKLKNYQTSGVKIQRKGITGTPEMVHGISTGDDTTNGAAAPKPAANAPSLDF